MGEVINNGSMKLDNHSYTAHMDYHNLWCMYVMRHCNVTMLFQRERWLSTIQSSHFDLKEEPSHHERSGGQHGDHHPSDHHHGREG